ncbi:MAG: phosphatidylglycerol lysyltransferase domain-containing protein, partial [Rothia mucilaginosa]
IIQMGEEAVLEADRFTLNDTSMLPVRQAVQRVRRGGYTAQMRRFAELDEQQRQQVAENISAWRHGRVERGFSMALNRVNDPADSSSVLVSAHDEADQMVALLSFVPWGPTGLSLDVMRRSPEAPNGVVEFMVASLMEQAASLGVRRVSLNFAMFGHIFEAADQVGASAWNRFASRSLGVLDRFLQLRRLYRFNLKFAPLWVPRFLATEPTLAMANVVVAAGMAEGFLPNLSARRLQNQEQVLSADELEALHQMQLATMEELPEVSRSDQTQHRLRHLEALRAAGMEPYPLGGEKAGTAASVLGVKDALRIFSSENIPDSEFMVSGRVRALRNHGGVLFVTLIEGDKTLQVIMERSLVGERPLSLASRNLDTGDIITVQGTYGASRNGTQSLIATSWHMASKSLHPIPFDSFTDPEARLRRRSTDLLVHPDQMQNLRLRTAVIKALRARLDAEGFLEVETPILHTVHGGASARPFRTYINAYGEDLTLRIAPELYLKRLVVGGSGPVYELGRDFRNEGADATHNPEFTVLEAYRPYADYVQMR